MGVVRSIRHICAASDWIALTAIPSTSRGRRASAALCTFFSPSAPSTTVRVPSSQHTQGPHRSAPVDRLRPESVPLPSAELSQSPPYNSRRQRGEQV
ncbi:hypothetical protein C8Q80DRAFT_376204 [Daedaleopsis nitida]|nr:hypothetical protein C8Q80DRAFT_376204 [Daedaleopsis nitida]